MLHLIDLSPVVTLATPTRYAVNLGDDLALVEVEARDVVGAVRSAAHLTGRMDQSPPGPVAFEVFEAPHWLPECVWMGDPCDVEGTGCDGSCALMLDEASVRHVVQLHVAHVDGRAVLVEVDGVA